MKYINANEIIKVKLMDKGKDIYYHRFDEINKIYGKEICKPSFPKIDENGFTEFQLWDFINLYGPYFMMGMDNVIEHLNIYFDESVLHEVEVDAL